MKKKEVFLEQDQDFITLQSVLKIAGIIQTGGWAKAYLSDNSVMVNGEEENRRGRKLYLDDRIEAEGLTILIKKNDC